MTEYDSESDIDDFIADVDDDDGEAYSSSRRSQNSSRSKKKLGSERRARHTTESPRSPRSFNSKYFRDRERSTRQEDRYEELYSRKEPDIRDFIADDDEVEEEEEYVQKKRSRKAKLEKHEDSDMEVNNGKKRKRILIDSDQENDGINSLHSQMISLASRKRVIDDSGDSDEEEFRDGSKDGDDSDDDGDDSDDESITSTDGVAFYARIDAKLDRSRDLTKEEAQDESQALLGNKLVSLCLHCQVFVFTYQTTSEFRSSDSVSFILRIFS